MELELLSLKRAALVALTPLIWLACSAGTPPPPDPPPPPPEPPPADTAVPAAGSSEAPPAPPAPSAAAPAPPPEPPPPEPIIPDGATVLHIGDSMAGALGIELNHSLRASGVRSILRFKTASFIPTWASGTEIPIYMQRYDPDLTLITLGANEVQIKDPTIREGAIRKLVSKLGGRPCVWIAPPLWKAGDTGLLPIIAANCAPCRFMDTNALVKNMPRVSDKIHPTMGARKVWAKFVVDWLVHQRDMTASRRWALLPESEPTEQGPVLDFAAIEPAPPK